MMFGELCDTKGLINLLLSYGVHLVVLILLVFGIYYTTFRRKNFVFTFFLIGTIVFFLSYVMSKLNLNVGFALGLFAIFGIIRYRTDQIPIREMTYLFIVIGLSVLNGVNKHTLSLIEAVVLNVLIILTVFVFEKVLDLRTESFKLIIYEKLDLLRPGSENELLRDLRERTGVNVERVDVLKYNYTKNSAIIKAYYHSKKMENGSETYMMGGDDGDDD
jgi:hypothetical protein